MANNTTENNRTGYPMLPPGMLCMPPMQEPDFGTADYVAKKLWLTLPPIIIIVGVTGNMLTVLVLLKQRVVKWSSTAVYLFALAISDTVLLLNSPLRNWILRGLEKHDVRHLSELGCKFSLWFTYTSFQYSSWLLVAVTLERMISVMWPTKVKQGCTKVTSSVIVVAIFVMLGALNAHFFYGQGVSTLPQYNGRGFCEILYKEHIFFSEKVWPWIDFGVTFAVPFAILISSNIAIIIQLRRTQIARRKMSISQRDSDKTFANEKRVITIMLILLSVMFFISLTPVHVYFIVAPYTRDEIQNLMCTDFNEFARRIGVERLVNTVVNILSYINASVNFILYVFSGTKFRNELKSLITCTKSGVEDVFGGQSSGSSVRRKSTLTTETGDSNSIRLSGVNITGVDNVNLQPDGSMSN